MKEDLSDFDETKYLKKYPEIAQAVANGYIPSGKWHYVRHGRAEGRTLDDTITPPVTNRSTLWQSMKKWAPFHEDIEDFSEFNRLVDRIKKNESFHVARYNDGEWVFMLQTEPYFSKYIRNHGHNQEEVIAISKKLLSIIEKQPEYYIGIDSTTRALRGTILTKRETFSELIKPLKNVIYGDIFNLATVRFGITALTEPLKDRTIITMGPDYMNKLGISKLHISVPSNNCWSQANKLEATLRGHIIGNLKNHPVILYSCSLLAKLLIDNCYHSFGDKITQLDIGSCIDPWCGLASRPWHRELAKHYNLGPLLNGPVLT